MVDRCHDCSVQEDATMGECWSSEALFVLKEANQGRKHHLAPTYSSHHEGVGQHSPALEIMWYDDVTMPPAVPVRQRVFIMREGVVVVEVVTKVESEVCNTYSSKSGMLETYDRLITQANIFSYPLVLIR